MEVDSFINIICFSTVEFYIRPNGRVNLRLNNFTFYKHTKARTNAYRWSCTSYGSKWKCRAHLIISTELKLLKADLGHTHPPSFNFIGTKVNMNKVDFIANEVPPLIKAYFEMTEPVNKPDVHVKKTDVRLLQKEAWKRSVNEGRSPVVSEMWNGSMPIISNTQTLTPMPQYTVAHGVFDNSFSDLR